MMRTLHASASASALARPRPRAGGSTGSAPDDPWGNSLKVPPTAAATAVVGQSLSRRTSVGSIREVEWSVEVASARQSQDAADGGVDDFNPRSSNDNSATAAVAEDSAGFDAFDPRGAPEAVAAQPNLPSEVDAAFQPLPPTKPPVAFEATFEAAFAPHEPQPAEAQDVAMQQEAEAEETVQQQQQQEAEAEAEAIVEPQEVYDAEVDSG